MQSDWCSPWALSQRGKVDLKMKAFALYRLYRIDLLEHPSVQRHKDLSYSTTHQQHSSQRSSDKFLVAPPNSTCDAYSIH